jgi:hypothetical protein
MGRASTRRRTRRAATAIAACVSSLWALGGCSSSAAVDEAATERVVIPPVLVWSRSGNHERESRSLLGPFFRHALDDTGSMSKRSIDILWPLFAHRSTSESSGAGGVRYDRRTRVLGGLLYASHADNYGRGYLDVQFLWPLGHYFRGEDASRDEVRSVESFRFLPIMQYRRSWRPMDPSKSAALQLDAEAGETREEEIRIDEKMYLRIVNVGVHLFGLEVEPEVRRQFVLGGVPTNDDGSKITFGLWGHEQGPSADYEHQLLWRAVLLKKWGSREIASAAADARKPSDFWRAFEWLWHGPPRTQVRLGPIMTYEADWSADVRRLSVLFGLFSMDRDGDRRSIRLLWVVPLSWQMASASSAR